MKRICQTQNKPVHEVMNWPADELLWWQVFYSIDDNQDKPIIDRKKQQEKISTAESIAQFKGVFNNGNVT